MDELGGKVCGMSYWDLDLVTIIHNTFTAVVK